MSLRFDLLYPFVGVVVIEGEQLGWPMNEGRAPKRPVKLGHASIAYKPARSILTKASGFMGDYDFTLNPYAGCAFGCSYCYAAGFARTEEQRADWGHWVEVKENALLLLRRMRTPLAGKRIYMSSVTDPYQPIEKRLGLVRELLEVLVDEGAHLVVQTRSPLVTRDLDVLARFERVRVNVTVTTDDEAVRKAFEPLCSNNSVRLAAVTEVAAAGLDAGVTMTPLLPLTDPERFARALAATGAQRFVVQPFHSGAGRFAAGTREGAEVTGAALGWTPDRYRQAVAALRRHLPSLEEGREGFAPA